MTRLNAISGFRPFLLLAPHNAGIADCFQDITRDPNAYIRRLTDMQVMRGSITLKEGEIHNSDLDAESRHIMSGDTESWHILRLLQNGSVCGCVRILVHSNYSTFSDLRLASSAIAKSVDWGPRVRAVVDAEIALALGSKSMIVEPGGWVIDEMLRGSPEAVAIALSVFAWSQLVGKSLAYVTATVKHGSSCMLRRLGGRSLNHDGVDIPRYYDPEYNCEMELLHIDQNSLNPRFESAMKPLRELLAAS